MTDENTQIVRKPDRTPLSKRDPVQLAQHFFASGYFKDTKSMSQAVVKICAGEELGIGPMAAMNGFHIIEGKPSPSANLLATQVKRFPQYDYKILESSPLKVSLEFFQEGESQGVITYELGDLSEAKAKENGAWKPLLETTRWKSWPEDMLFARAITRGVRRFCPDVTSGNPVYTPDELGADHNEQGEVIEAAPAEQIEEATAQVELDEDKYQHLRQAFQTVQPDLKETQLMLGACGIDSITSMAELDDRLIYITDDQFDSLAAELNGFADRQAESDADQASAEAAEAEGADAEVVQ